MFNRKVIVWLCMSFMLVAAAFAWSGIPPTNLFLYGQATVNGSGVSPGDNISVHEIDDSNELLVQVTVSSSGWYPAMNIPWDDPDTGGDEGLTYSYPAKLGFKINGHWVEYINSTSSSITSNRWDGAKGYITVDDGGIEGIPTQVDLISFPNYAPQISVESQVVAQDALLNFTINATDNTTYRTDALTITQSGALTSLLQTSFTSVAQAYATWTPNCNHACTGTFNPTYNATDDGRPGMSDSKAITITVTNVNDTPNINDASISVLVNTLKPINLMSVLGYSDCDSCFADAHIFALVSTSNLTNETNFTITNSSTGAAEFISDTVGVYKFNISVNDSAGLSDMATLTIAVTTLDMIEVKTIRANGLRNYEVTDIVYNFNNESKNFTNLTLEDPDLGTNRTFDLDYRDSISFKSNVTLSGTGIVDFAIAKVHNDELGAIYYSNEPSVYIGVEAVARAGRDVERIYVTEIIYCGDGECGMGEDCHNCPADCGICPVEEEVPLVEEEVPEEEKPAPVPPYIPLWEIVAILSLETILLAILIMLVKSRGIFKLRGL